MQTKICRICKETKPIEDFHKENRGKYGVKARCKKCVNECKKDYDREYYKDNIEHYREYYKGYRKNHKEKRKCSKHARRALEKGSITEKINLIQIYTMRNWICGVCHKKINKKLKYPNPKSVSLDHIIPITKGGNHIESNVQPAHLRCNSIKGNRVNNIQLKLI